MQLAAPLAPCSLSLSLSPSPSRFRDFSFPVVDRDPLGASFKSTWDSGIHRDEKFQLTVNERAKQPGYVINLHPLLPLLPLLALGVSRSTKEIAKLIQLLPLRDRRARAIVHVGKFNVLLRIVNTFYRE